MSTAVTTETKPAPAAIEKIKVKVDGREIEVPRTMPDPISGKPIATTMIQACELARQDVPHYCYHPKLPVPGTCRNGAYVVLRRRQSVCAVKHSAPARLTAQG